MQVGLAGAQHLAPAGRGRRDAQAQEGQRASIRMATEDRITTCTRIGLQELGSTVRNML